VRGELNTSAVDRREEPGDNSRTTFWEEEEEEAAEDAEEEDASSCRAAMSWCALREACSQKLEPFVYLLCKTPIKRTF
jgi:hypothetical protein